MANGNRTTSTPRRATAAKATPTVSAPAIAKAPWVDSNRIEVHGYRVEELAGLVRMCGESIYKELVSIGRSYSDALVQHSQSVTDYIDTLADILCETAAQIRGDAEKLGGCPVLHVTAAKRFPRKRSGASTKPL